MNWAGGMCGRHRGHNRDQVWVSVLLAKTLALRSLKNSRARPPSSTPCSPWRA